MCYRLALVSPPVRSPGNKIGSRGDIGSVKLGLLSFGDRQNRSIGPHKPLDYHFQQASQDRSQEKEEGLSKRWS